jgi:SAM-dependent methyltransferase
MARSYAPEFDRINRRTYAAKRVLRQYGTATGWLEPGERAAFELIAAAVRGRAILDIGVGGGRTTPLMLSLSTDYRGIDYCLAMVDVARHRFPNVQFLEMDARRLDLGQGSIDLVAFTYNGIDSVDLEGRREILHNVYRVLRPAGYFVFSALNRQGTAHNDGWPDFSVFHGLGWWPNTLLHALGRLALGGVNRLRLRPLLRDEEDVAIGNITAHNFGLITLFLSLKAQLQELANVGFRVEAVFEPEGRRLAADGSEESDAPWHHFVAHKPIGGTSFRGGTTGGRAQ